MFSHTDDTIYLFFVLDKIKIFPAELHILLYLIHVSAFLRGHWPELDGGTRAARPRHIIGCRAMMTLITCNQLPHLWPKQKLSVAFYLLTLCV